MSSIAINNVCVFTEGELSTPKTVVIENGLITAKSIGDENIDGTGCTLLPGLIDAHVHVDYKEQLEDAAKAGVTTMFEMANFSVDVLNSLKNYDKGSSLLGCCYPATAEAKMNFLPNSIVKNKEDAKRYVDEVVSLGADFIKIIIEEPIMNMTTKQTPVTFPQEVITAIVEAAHDHNKLTVAHAATPGAYKMGIDAGVDILTHIPFMPIPQSIIDLMVEKNIMDIPTMSMMEGVLSNIKKVTPQIPFEFNNIIENMKKLIEAGVTIMAGTDANDQSQAPFQIPHGTTLHHELELLVKAGFTPTKALCSATNVPAKIFGLNDRGVIEPGKRADLLLVEGDPTTDIEAIKNIKGVWVNGKKLR